MGPPEGGAPGGGPPAPGLPPPLTAAATVEDRSAAAGGGGAAGAGGGGFSFPALSLARPGAGPRGAPGAGPRGRGGKVPLEAGCSQMAWLREARALERARPRPRRDVTLAEVAAHATPDDCWTVLRGRVYALSPYFRFHPGGARILDQVSGRDCTRLFQKYHAWVNERMLIGALLVGELAPAQEGPPGGAGAAARRGPGGG